MTEELTEELFSEDFDGSPVERFDLHGVRWYSPIVEEETEWADRIFAPSVTTVLNIVDKGIGWNKWLGNSPSYESAMDFAREAALVGSIVHDFIDQMTHGQTIELPTENGEHTTHSRYIDTKTLESHDIWPRRKLIQKRLMAYQKFHAVRFIDMLASEIMLFAEDFAGTADFVGHIKFGKKEPLVLIDYKTGKEYADHQLQLSGLKIAWDLAFPDNPIEEIFCLYLTERGSFTLKRFEFDPEGWEHALGLWTWDHKKLLIDGVWRPRQRVDLPTTFTLIEEEEEENA